MRLRTLTAAGMMTLWMASQSAAAELGLPTNVCYDDCGPRQLDLWERFEQGASLEPKQLSGVYSGSCYVIGQGLSPDHEHHVGFLIDEGDDVHNLYLRFSFFASSQPYDELNPNQARTDFREPVLPLSLYEEFAYADIQTDRFFSRYWFRQDVHSESVLLVSYFGYRTTILCDAVENRYAMDDH